ncbi:MAG: hypothetical protein ACMVY4_08605 [Minwuia sp.]|uniref:hypothetical protein n=1 Tax=Minwuia sp. TaxID=2493630 RepID=UPI003A8977D7
MAALDDMLGPESGPDVNTGSELANSAVFLALYLILLGFFLMLNAHATLSEDRTRAMVAGLRLDPVVPPIAPVTDTAIVADPLEQRLKDVFGEHMPDGEWDLVSRAGRILIRIPLHRAFSDDSSVLQPGRISLMRRMAEVIGEAQTMDGLAVSVTIGKGPDADLARRRAASLGRDMLRYGLAHDRFDIGADAAAAGSIELELRTAADEGRS